MDPTQIKKIQAMKRYKRRQFLDNLYFYFFSTLTCSFIFFFTLCLPYLSSHVRVFFLVHISSLIHSSQTRMPHIPATEVNKAKTLEKLHFVENMDKTLEDGPNSVDLKGNGWVKKATEAWLGKEVENLEGGDEQSFLSSSDELNKRAEDFIARVNRQRKLELILLKHDNY
ncbi:uncharacterized protein LOC113856629 [Abrus precatorius]|uniref:Uncharacterized protein LOC113856629 n=1 Tax=Abrus precatorius TaxID=3816 RepID=A0A8B8KKI9_ABRPR|nr:uncharacterized protein LOC113856629 [Abrus precatorius]